MASKKPQSPWSFVAMGVGALAIGLLALGGAVVCTFSPEHPACRSKPDEPKRLSKIGLVAVPMGGVMLAIGVWELRTRQKRRR